MQAGKLPRWLTDSIALFEYAAAADDFEHNGAPSEGRKLRPKLYEPKQVNQLEVLMLESRNACLLRMQPSSWHS